MVGNNPEDLYNPDWSDTTLVTELRFFFFYDRVVSSIYEEIRFISLYGFFFFFFKRTLSKETMTDTRSYPLLQNLTTKSFKLYTFLVDPRTIWSLDLRQFRFYAILQGVKIVRVHHNNNHQIPDDKLIILEFL